MADAMDVDPREAKLPKWAQGELARLRANAAHWKCKYAAVRADGAMSRVAIHGFYTGREPTYQALEDDSKIVFRPDQKDAEPVCNVARWMRHREISVALNSNYPTGILVSADRLLVEPAASNAVIVSGKGWPGRAD